MPVALQYGRYVMYAESNLNEQKKNSNCYLKAATTNTTHEKIIKSSKSGEWTRERECQREGKNEHNDCNVCSELQPMNKHK